MQENALSPAAIRFSPNQLKLASTLFVKQKKKKPVRAFPGSSGIRGADLLKEYRRDIKRFLRQERETYPYNAATDTSTTQQPRLLAEFKEAALAHRAEEQLASFPETVVSDVTKYLAILGDVHL